MNNYHILDQIGEGSFGRVYKARRKFTGRIVAIKMINKLGQSKEDISSFRSEIDILKKVDHPNIMRHIEIFETNTDICLVSELARGDLFQIIDDNQTLPEEILKSVAAQLVSALTDLHKRRIIHRDMKPQNVLICANGALKVCDFGFARALSNNTLVLTSIKGTPLYMAPELVQEQPYDEKVDVWSLGVILYELYYGKTPFFTNSIYKLIQMIVNEKITWPGKISEEFQDFLLQMLQKNPQRRSSCAELLTHPFISKVPLTPYDDSNYRMKKDQFDEAIKESFSDSATLPFKPPEQSAPDYQGILLNPSSHTAEELLLAVKYLNGSDISAESPLITSFAIHFAEFIKQPLVAEESLKVATIMLKTNPSEYLRPLKEGLCILGETDMPHASIDFFTELLVIPYVVKMVNLLDLSQNDLKLDDEKAEKLRDKLLSFLFTSDPVEASKTYAFLSFLVQVSSVFVNAISGQFASQVVPIITSSVIHRTSSPVTAGALAILSKIVEKNGTSIQYIQPITEFVKSFFTILKEVPTSLDSFCVYSAAMSFFSISFNLISQMSDFQRLFGFDSKSSDMQTFISTFYGDDINELSQTLLKYGCEKPVNQTDYLSFVSILSSPFSHLPISPTMLDSFIKHINSLCLYHQPSLLHSIFDLPVQDVINSLPSLLHLFDVSSCTDPFAEFLLKHAKKKNVDSNFISSLLKCNVPVKLSQLIANQGPETSPKVISLLAHIILLNSHSTPELVNQSGEILRSVFAVDISAEAGLIIASHFARLGSDFNDVLDKCGALSFIEKNLESSDKMIQARALNFIGNYWKNGSLRDDIAQSIFPQMLNKLKTEKDKTVKRFAAFAIGNAIYSSPEFGWALLKEFDVVLKLLDDESINDASNLEICDCAAGIICNMLHTDSQYVQKLKQYRSFDLLFTALSKGKELGSRILMRITALCKYEETRKLLKVKSNRAIIQKYTKINNDDIKNMAQSILRIIDA